MTNPEVSLETRPLRDRFLDLAAIICRREFKALQPWGGTRLAYSWRPLNQQSFKIPIMLDRVTLTNTPTVNSKFIVTDSEFEILGDEAMKFQVSREMKDKEFPDDEWNKMVFARFAGSYVNHVHSICEANFPPESTLISSTETFKILDKRIR